MKARFCAPALVAAALTLASAASVQAQCGPGCGCGSCGAGCGCGTANRFSTGLIYHAPPHFYNGAVHRPQPHPPTYRAWPQHAPIATLPPAPQYDYRRGSPVYPTAHYQYHR